MTREIIFRGKRLQDGAWVYGNLMHNKASCRIVNYTDHPDSCVGMVGVDCHYHDVDERTVGQFTGQTDKGGKQIYEKDIVKAPLLDPIFGDVLSDAFCEAVIEFNNGAFVVSYYSGEHKIYLQDLQNKIEVIGDIHETPKC